MKLGDAFYEIIGDDSGLDKSFSDADKKAQRGTEKMSSGIKQKLGGVFSVMGGVLGAQVVGQAVGAVKDFFTEAIGAGSDAEEMLSKFAVTFGGETDSMSNRLEEFAAQTGRSKFELKGMAANFGAVLKGMGLGEDATAGFSGSLAELAVDWGSFANLDSTDVMEKFRAGITGEYESLKSMGIVINAAMVDQELLNMGIEGGAKAATQAQLVQARYNLIMAASGDAIGDAARTAGSWANQQVALKATWKDFMTEMGQGTTQVLGPLMQQFTGMAQNVLPKIASALTDKVMPAIAKGVDFFGRLFAVISTGDIGGLSDVLYDISVPLSDLVLSMGETVPAAFESAKAALAPLMALFADALPRALEIARNIFDEVAPFVMILVGQMGSFIMEQFGGVVSWIQDNMPLIKDTIDAVLTGIQAVWDVVWPYLQETAVVIFENLKIQISTIINAVLGIIKAVMLAITGDWEGAWTEIKTVAENLLSGIYQIIENSINLILGFFGTSIDQMVQAGADLIMGLVDGIKSKANAVIDAAKAVVNDAISAAKKLLGIQSPSTVFLDIGLNMMAGLADGIDEGQAKVMKNLAKTVKELVTAFGRLLGFDAAAASSNNITTVLANLETTLLQAMSTIERIIDQVGYNRIHKLKLTARRLREILDAVLVDLSGVKETDLSGLTSWATGMESVLIQVLGIVERMRDQYGEKLLEAFATLSGYLGDVFKLMGIDLSKIVPSDVDGFDVHVDTYFSQVEIVGRRIMDWLREINANDVWVAALTEAAKIAPMLEAIFKLLGPDLAKIAPNTSSTFEDDTTTFFDQLKEVGRHIMDWLRDIQSNDVWSAALLAVQGIAEQLINIFKVIAIDLSKIAPSNSLTFTEDLDVFFSQLKSVGRYIMDWLREIDANPIWLAALEAVQPIADNLKNIFEIIQIDIQKVIPQNTKSFSANIASYFEQLKEIGRHIMDWLREIDANQTWEDALAAVQPIADNLVNIFSILDIELDFKLGGAGLTMRLDAFIADLKEAAPILRDGIRDIAAEWSSVEALAADVGLSQQIQDVFGILNLAGSIDSLVRIQGLAEGEYYTALSNVVTQLIADLKQAAPLLKTGLADVAILFGDALQSSIDISASIAALFDNIGSVVATIKDMTGTEWDVSDLLNIIGDIGQIAGSAGALMVKTEPGDYADWFAELKTTIMSAITESFEFIIWRLDVHFYQDERERAQWSMEFNALQQQVDSINMQLSALTP